MHVFDFCVTNMFVFTYQADTRTAWPSLKFEAWWIREGTGLRVSDLGVAGTVVAAQASHRDWWGQSVLGPHSGSSQGDTGSSRFWQQHRSRFWRCLADTQWQWELLECNDNMDVVTMVEESTPQVKGIHCGKPESVTKIQCSPVITMVTAANVWDILYTIVLYTVDPFSIAPCISSASHFASWQLI